MQRKHYTWGWLLWGAFFVALEGFAVANDQLEGTLSNHVRHWVGESAPEQTLSTRARRGVLLIFMGWLTGHLVMGWWG